MRFTRVKGGVGASVGRFATGSGALDWAAAPRCNIPASSRSDQFHAVRFNECNRDFSTVSKSARQLLGLLGLICLSQMKAAMPMTTKMIRVVIP